MADPTLTLVRFKVHLSLDAEPNQERGPQSLGKSSKSGGLTLNLEDERVTEGCGELAFANGSTSKDWLMSQLEHHVVEKMCQVARQGIDKFVAGGLRSCEKDLQSLFPASISISQDPFYPISLPSSQPETPDVSTPYVSSFSLRTAGVSPCTASRYNDPHSFRHSESLADVSTELVEDSDQPSSVAPTASLGVAFRPTDQELLSLLKDRVENGTGHVNIEEMPQTAHAIEPDTLLDSAGSPTGDAPTRSSARYFFCARERAKNGAWSRKTASGWWDQERNPNNFAPGDDDAQKVIFNHKSKGRQWTGLKWQMHEYQIAKNEPLVLCKVMQVADRPRRKPAATAARAPLSAANSEIPNPTTATSPLIGAKREPSNLAEKPRRLANKRPRVPLQLPTSRLSTSAPAPVEEPRAAKLEEAEPGFEPGLEPGFAADLFSLLAPSPRFGTLLAVPSPRGDAWIFHMLSQQNLQDSGIVLPGSQGPEESAAQSSRGDSTGESDQTDPFVGAGLGFSGETQESSFY